MLDLLNPLEDQFEVRDIAHALSQLCRFTGQTRFFYSVGLHSLLGSYLVPKQNALEFLLHDSSESFLGDLSRPLKHLTAVGAPYREIEERMMQVIRKKFGLPALPSEVIHEVDNAMLLAEKNQLMSPIEWSKESKDKCLVENSKAAKVVIYEVPCVEVEDQFLDRFEELYARRIN
jgi:5'-deoxynucleotidase YfbR-like HD superfamily hydrolase